MALFKTNNTDENIHGQDMQDVILAVPPWLIRRGNMVFLTIFIVLGIFASVIKYPDIISADLVINSPDAAKPVISKLSGKIVKILIKDHSQVLQGQALAYIESNADHGEVIDLLAKLEILQKDLSQEGVVENFWLQNSKLRQLGELQLAYQTFNDAFISYKSTIKEGFYLKKKSILSEDLTSLTQQIEKLNEGKKIQERNLELAKEDYDMHRKLYTAKVESQSEMRQVEAKYLSQKSPVVQTEFEMMNLKNSFLLKKKEILELENQLAEQKTKFIEALNSIISEIYDWKSKYILSAPQNGKLSYNEKIQQNQSVTSAENVFYIVPDNGLFFGQMQLPQNSMGKVRVGQKVLVKLNSYPFEEFGILRAKIRSISDISFNGKDYYAIVDLDQRSLKNMKARIELKQGMTATAEIVTLDATVLQRFTRGLLRNISGLSAEK